MSIQQWEQTAVRGPEDLISDWYLPREDPLGGFVYPGPIPIKGHQRLYELAQRLAKVSINKVADGNDEYTLRDDGRLYRGHRMHSVEGEIFALRRIPNVVPKDTDLGLSPADREVLQHEKLATGGLIIITGETGQGKSTTCAATIKARLEKFGSFCLTVEDPPELPLHGVHGNGRCIQTEVRAGDFADAMRGAMRCYPTVGGSMLYVGETRDSETAAEVLRVATNGHLVFTTLHGQDIISAMKRFISLATANKSSSEADIKSVFASAMRMVLHQRLRDLPNIQGQVGRKKLETSFLLSSDGSTPVAQKIRTSSIDQLNSEIQQQRALLDNQGLPALMRMWETGGR